MTYSDVGIFRGEGEAVAELVQLLAHANQVPAHIFGSR
jgi:hypothetical protein